MTLAQDDSTIRFFTWPCASRLAAACTTLSSVMTASPMPLVTASRAAGAEITSGNGSGDEFLGERLHVTLRNGAEQHQFQQLIVVHRFGAGLAEAVTQPLAVAMIVGPNFGKP
jgi:hypothetical protein